MILPNSPSMLRELAEIPQAKFCPYPNKRLKSGRGAVGKKTAIFGMRQRKGEVNNADT